MDNELYNLYDELHAKWIKAASVCPPDEYQLRHNDLLKHLAHIHLVIFLQEKRRRDCK
jgi:hypothetical protein